MESLLKPMRPDALLRRPAAQAQFDPAKAAPKLKPRAEAVQQTPADDVLDELLNRFLDETEDDEPLDDAVPTESMPVPVCVPLTEETIPERAWWWMIPVALGVAGAVACVMLKIL